MNFANIFSPTRSIIAKNTIHQLIGKIFTAGATFLISVLIARGYGADTYGDFTKVTTYVAFFYLLADFGMNAVYLQKTHEANESTTNGTKDNAWSTLFGARIFGSIILIFLCVGLLDFLPYSVNQGYTLLVRAAITVFSLSILFQAILTSANAQFQKRLRYDLSTIAIIVGSGISLLLIWYIIQYGYYPYLFLSAFESATLALLIGSGITVAIALLFVRYLRHSLLPSFSLAPMRDLFLQSLPLGVTLLFNLIYFRVDSLIMTISRSTLEVGIYGFAYKIFEVPLVFPTFFMNAVYPLFLKHTKEANQYELKRMVKQAFVFLSLASFVLLILFWITAPLVLLVRSEFAASVDALRILVLGLPFFFLSSLTMWTLIALKKQHVLAFIYGGSMICNVLLNAIFIPAHGYQAAAWITVLSEAFVFIISGFFVLRFI